MLARCLGLLALPTLVLLLPGNAWGGAYYCAAGHLSVSVPDGWQVVDYSEIRKAAKVLEEAGKATQTSEQRYDFALSPSGKLNYPYVLATVVPTGPIAESDVKEIVDAFGVEVRGGIEKSPLYSSLQMGEPSYEKEDHRLRLDFAAELYNGTRVDARIYGLFANSGVVFLYCYAPGGHLAEYASTFDDMVGSASFDRGYGWDPPPTLPELEANARESEPRVPQPKASAPGVRPSRPGLWSAVPLTVRLLIAAVALIAGLEAVWIWGLRRRGAGSRPLLPTHAAEPAGGTGSLGPAMDQQSAGAGPSADGTDSGAAAGPWEVALAGNLPRWWLGFGAAAGVFIVEFAKDPQVVQVAALVAWAYWLYCVYELHYRLALATDGMHPITPFSAVVGHFIPVYNLYWVFAWPNAVGAAVHAQLPSRQPIRNLAGALVLGGLLVGRVVDAAVGVALVFAAGMYLSRELAATLAPEAEFEADQVGEREAAGGEPPAVAGPAPRSARRRTF